MSSESFVLNEQYDSFGAFMDAVMRGPSSANRDSFHVGDGLFASGHSRSKDWDGGIGNVGAYRKFVGKGWESGTKKMHDLAASFAPPKAKSVKRKTAFGEEGSEVDIDRMMRGEVDVMWRTTKRESGGGAKRHIKVVANCSGGGRRESDDFFWRGAVACVIADALEDAGYRVELGLYHYSRGTYKRNDKSTPDHFASVMLKRYDEALDVSRMAALTAHPAFLRVAMFANILTGEAIVREELGHPIHTTAAADAKQTVYGLPEQYVEAGDLVIDGIWTREQAVAFLKQIETRFN